MEFGVKLRTRARSGLIRSIFIRLLSFSKHRFTTKLCPAVFSIFFDKMKKKFLAVKKIFGKKNLVKNFTEIFFSHKIFIFVNIQKMKKTAGHN